MNAKDFIENVKSLPASPQVLPRLLKLIRREETSSFEVVDLVKVDPALSAQVLALSNSSYYGYASKCLHVDEAVGRIGFSELYKMVSLLLSKNLVSSPITSYGLEQGELWENSVACAMSMEFFAQKLGIDPLLAYTTGLFHSLGKLVIDQEAGEGYEEVFSLMKEKSLSLNAAEEATFGFDHAEVAGELLKKWKFEKSVYEPIFYQFHPFKSKDYLLSSCMLHLSLWVTGCIGKNFGRESWAIEVDEAVLDQLKLSEEDLHSCVLEVHDRLSDVKNRLIKGVLD